MRTSSTEDRCINITIAPALVRSCLAIGLDLLLIDCLVECGNSAAGGVVHAARLETRGTGGTARRSRLRALAGRQELLDLGSQRPERAYLCFSRRPADGDDLDAAEREPSKVR